jgi:hypothetical protein
MALSTPRHLAISLVHCKGHLLRMSTRSLAPPTFTMDSTTSIGAMMARLYSPTSRQWSLNWANEKTARFDTPTIGEFKDGRGEFYDQEL